MAYSRWQDAMVAQTRIHDYYSTTDGVNYLRGFFDDMNSKHTATAQMPGDLLSLLQRRMVREGEPIYVSYDACEVIDEARETFQPEPVLPSDPFVTCGFALFAKALSINDGPVSEQFPLRSPSGIIPIRAVCWLPVHNEDYSAGTFWIGFYTHIDDELLIDPNDERFVGDEQKEKFVSHMRRFMPLSLVHQWQWTWGKGWEDWYAHLDITSEDDKSSAHLRARQQLMLMQTLWRIGSQFLPARQAPDRGFRREAKRKGMKHHEEVNVVTLRRTRPDKEHEPTGRELTIQFPVNGYWAIRHTHEGPRQVWVRSHMKGNPDHPLVVKKRAWEFKR